MKIITTPIFVGSGYSPPDVDRIWVIWGSYDNIPKAIFCLLKGDYRVMGGENE